MANAESRQGGPLLEIGDVFSQTFDVWSKNLVPFLTLGVILNLIPVLLQEAIPVLSFITQVIFSNALTAAITYGVVEHMMKRERSLGDLISKGFGAVVGAILVSIVASIAIVAGSILCLVPGIIVACMFAVAVPVAVIEKQGVGAALSRSQFLTKGARLQIFAIYLVGALIGAVVIVPLMFWVGIDAISGGRAGATAVEPPDVPLVFTLGMFVTSVVMSTLFSTATAVIYSQLRQAKEGIDVEAMASAFD